MGILVHLVEFSNCCSRGTPPCCHRCQEAHTGTCCNICCKRMCTLYSWMPWSNDMHKHPGTLSPKKAIHKINYLVGGSLLGLVVINIWIHAIDDSLVLTTVGPLLHICVVSRVCVWQHCMLVSVLYIINVGRRRRSNITYVIGEDPCQEPHFHFYGRGGLC